MKQYYPSFDGWRGIAILLILLGHISYLYNFDIQSFGKGLMLNTHLLPVTVNIFFFISGFLAAGALLGEDKIHLKAYFERRLYRIVPQYAALLLVVYILSLVTPPFSVRMRVLSSEEYDVVKIEKNADAKTIATARPSKDRYSFTRSGMGQHTFEIAPDSGIKEGDKITLPTVTEGLERSNNPKASFLPYLFFVQNYTENFPMVGHTWFLSILVHFYIFFGLLVFSIFRLTRDDGMRKLSIFIVLFLLLSAIVYIRGNTDAGLAHATHLRLDAMFWGCLLWLLEETVLMKKVLRSPLLRASSLLIGLFIAIGIYFKAPYKNYPFTAGNIAIALMIIGTFRMSVLSRITIENSFLRWVGRHSYAIYVWHIPLMFYSAITRNYIHSGNIYLDNYIPILLYITFAVSFGAFMEKALNYFSLKLMGTSTISLPRSG